ncbi:hypothetical protein IWQ60_008899 [Tieghemiomyces parasiticus]|uniref:Uncharacterized protein n=1 Tax=Tieghemiomyces parasiticus TaxID=78921 RepID=A0A9W8DR42_9FUNG|nr:hypothetical protein IWQ60_008899 [Tieghemiomyces parasiticus]
MLLTPLLQVTIVLGWSAVVRAGSFTLADCPPEVLNLVDTGLTGPESRNLRATNKKLNYCLQGFPRNTALKRAEDYARTIHSYVENVIDGPLQTQQFEEFWPRVESFARAHFYRKFIIEPLQRKFLATPGGVVYKSPVEARRADYPANTDTSVIFESEIDFEDYFEALQAQVPVEHRDAAELRHLFEARKLEGYHPILRRIHRALQVVPLDQLDSAPDGAPDQWLAYIIASDCIETLIHVVDYLRSEAFIQRYLGLLTRGDHLPSADKQLAGFFHHPHGWGRAGPSANYLEEAVTDTMAEVARSLAEDVVQSAVYVFAARGKTGKLLKMIKHENVLRQAQVVSEPAFAKLMSLAFMVAAQNGKTPLVNFLKPAFLPQALGHCAQQAEAIGWDQAAQAIRTLPNYSKQNDEVSGDLDIKALPVMASAHRPLSFLTYNQAVLLE